MYALSLETLLLVASLLYCVSPVDMVPDLTPIFGWIDDLAVFLIVYLNWRSARHPFKQVSRPTRETASRFKASRNESSAKSRRRQSFAPNLGGGGDPYQVLGLKAPASQSEIRLAFKNMARECHPDRYATLGSDALDSAHEQMIRVSNAYHRLRKVA